MQKTLNLPVSIVVIIAVIGGLLYYQNTKLSNKYDRASTALKIALNEAKDSIHNYKVKVDSLTYTVAEKEMMVLTEREAKKLGLIDRDKYKSLYLKKVSENINLQADVRVWQEAAEKIPDSTIIYLSDTIACLKLPYNFIGYDEYMWYNAHIALPKPTIEFGITLPISIYIDHKSDGLFKKSVPTAVVTSPSDYVTFSEIQSLHIVKEKKFYQQWWFLFGTGVVSGFVLDGVLR